MPTDGNAKMQRPFCVRVGGGCVLGVMGPLLGRWVPVILGGWRLPAGTPTTQACRSGKSKYHLGNKPKRHRGLKKICSVSGHCLLPIRIISRSQSKHVVWPQSDGCGLTEVDTSPQKQRYHFKTAKEKLDEKRF